MIVEVIADKTVTDLDEPIVASNVYETSEQGLFDEAIASTLLWKDAKKLCEVDGRASREGGRCETCTQGYIFSPKILLTSRSEFLKI